MAQTAQTVLLSAFFNTGQVCIAAKRIYVHEDIYDEFKATLAQVVKAFQGGQATRRASCSDRSTTRCSTTRLASFFEEAKKEKFSFIAGGPGRKARRRLLLPAQHRRQPPRTADWFRRSRFGPIVPLLKWKDEADLIKRVNDSSYGLGATIQVRTSRKLSASVVRSRASGTV